MANRHGKNSRIILDGVVIKCTAFDLDQSTDKADVTGFGDANKRVVLGTPNFAATFSGWWDDAVDKLFDITSAGLPVNGYFYPDASNAPTQYWWGSVYVDAKISSSVTSAVGISGSVSAEGAMTRAGVP